LSSPRFKTIPATTSTADLALIQANWDKANTDMSAQDTIINALQTGDSGPAANAARVSTPFGITYPTLKDRVDATDTRIKDRGISVKDYGASGSAQTTTGSITSGSNILTLALAKDFLNGQGINIMGKCEIASLSVTAGASTSANCTVTLDGVAKTVALTSGNTAVQVATAIRAATFPGWTTGGSGTTVTFTSLSTGNKPDASYSAGTTSATGTMTITTQGTPDFITTITSGAGTTTLTLASNASNAVTGVKVEHDDTSALRSAITALTTIGGGSIILTPGAYLISSTLYISVPIVFKGIGRKVCSIITKTSNIDMIEVDSDNVVFEDLTIWNQSTGVNTSGSSIKLTSGQSFTLNRCDVNGSYYAVNVINALLWTLSNSYFTNYHKYGIYVKNTASPDTGDQVIIGCTFDENVGADACIRHESGGGLKIIGNKFLDSMYAYDLQVADGVATSVLIISGNSIENQTTAGIRLGRLGATGTYGKVAITGNQFSSVTSIILDNGVYSTNFSDNVHSGDTTGTAIVMNYGSIASITGENIYNYAKGITLSTNTLYSKIGDNFFFNTPITVENNASFLNNVQVVHNYMYKYNIASSSVYEVIFQLDLGANSGCSLELTFDGLVQGGTSFIRKIIKLLSRNGGACTVTDVADTAAGNAIDLSYDIATTSGSVIIGLRRNAGGGGTNVTGVVCMNIKGNVQKVKLLGSPF
jgi:hypothetical protein